MCEEKEVYLVAGGRLDMCTVIIIIIILGGTCIDLTGQVRDCRGILNTETMFSNEIPSRPPPHHHWTATVITQTDNNMLPLTALSHLTEMECRWTGQRCDNQVQSTLLSLVPWLNVVTAGAGVGDVLEFWVGCMGGRKVGILRHEPNNQYGAGQASGWQWPVCGETQISMETSRGHHHLPALLLWSIKQL